MRRFTGGPEITPFRSLRNTAQEYDRLCTFYFWRWCVLFAYFFQKLETFANWRLINQKWGKIWINLYIIWSAAEAGGKENVKQHHVWNKHQSVSILRWSIIGSTQFPRNIKQIKKDKYFMYGQEKAVRISFRFYHPPQHIFLQQTSDKCVLLALKRSDWYYLFEICQRTTLNCHQYKKQEKYLVFWQKHWYVVLELQASHNNTVQLAICCWRRCFPRLQHQRHHIRKCREETLPTRRPNIKKNIVHPF